MEKLQKTFNSLMKDRTTLWTVVLIGLIILAAFLRFYMYHDRLSIGGDDARDIAIAKESLERGFLPRFGSFSSAGPFVFGPLFYWILMGSYLLIPFSLFAPWIVTTLCGLGIVILMALIGKKLGGVWLGAITGILTAFSPQLVFRSLVVGQHTYVALFTVLAILFYILFWQEQKRKYAFLLGLMVGIAINMHYQALNLLLMLFFLFIVPKQTIKERIVAVLLSGLGIIIASIPLLSWDMQQQFANTRNILDYFLIGQYRLYVPNSWKLFLFSFLPPFWSLAVGGYVGIGIVAIIASGAGSVAKIVQERARFSVYFSLVLMVGFFLLINRYYKGERSEGYLLYLTPFIIIVSAAGIYSLSQLIARGITDHKSAVIGSSVVCVSFLVLVCAGDLLRIIPSYTQNSTKEELYQTVGALQRALPGTRSFKLYDNDFKQYYSTTAISALLKNKGLSSGDGYPLGVYCPNVKYQRDFQVLAHTVGNCELVDLSSMTSDQLRNEKWQSVNQEDLFGDLILRWESQPLQSSFSLTKYLSDKLSR